MPALINKDDETYRKNVRAIRRSIEVCHLLNNKNIPYHRKPWVRGEKTVTTLLDPPLRLKQKAVDLLYDIGQYILESYGCFEA